MTPLAPHLIAHAATGASNAATFEVLAGAGFVLGAFALYQRGVRRLWARAGVGAGISRVQARVYIGGLAVLGLALLAMPLLGLTERFPGHMAQHLLVVDVAAPLAALGAPATAFAWAALTPRGHAVRGWRAARRVLRPLASAPALVALHVAVLWAWHLPTLYDAAERNGVVHGLEHLTMGAAAFLLWQRVVTLARGAPHRQTQAAGMLFAVMLSGLALGAFLTFASAPLYHLAAETAGEAAMSDQQLGGLLMLMLGGLVYVGAMVVIGLRLIGGPVAEQRAPSGGDA